MQALDGALQPVVGHGLEQVIHRFALEGLHREFVIGRDEHHATGAPRFRREHLNQLQTGQAGHANVEKRNVGPQVLDHFPRFDAVGGNAGNLELRPQGGETCLEMLGQQRFVVGDDRLHGETPAGRLIVAVTPAPTPELNSRRAVGP